MVCGVANKKSVAWHIARQLTEADCRVIYSVRSEARREQIAKLVRSAFGQGEEDIFVCDVEHQEQIDQLAAAVKSRYGTIDGIVHSIAFADYEGVADESGIKPFHETPRRALLRTFDISCFSLVALSNALKESMAEDASVVTISISTTTMASENYGFMAPVKAALDSAIVFLAKSFSRFSAVRFNAVAPGLLKTSASAGIPGYVDSYLYAEAATLRNKAVQTEEAASAAVFLLSPRSSGINGQRVIVDAGMAANYFDEQLVKRFHGDHSTES